MGLKGEPIMQMYLDPSLTSLVLDEGTTQTPPKRGVGFPIDQ
jgi:hypothetical protein